jgi:hypothetical protein
MKKILAVFVMVAFLAGCAGFSFNTSSPDVVDTGKVIGKIVLIKYPEVAKIAVPYASGLLQAAKDGKIDSSAFASAISGLTAKCGADNDLVEAIGLGMALINVEIKTGTVNPTVVDLLTGFMAGITPAT